MTNAQQRQIEISIVKAARARGWDDSKVSDAVLSYRKSLENQEIAERKGKTPREVLKGIVEAPGKFIEAGAEVEKKLAKYVVEPFTRTAGTVVAGAQALAGNPLDEQAIENLGMFKPYETKREAIGGALQIGATLLPGAQEVAGAGLAATAAKVPQAVTQGTIGGATGLVYGSGKGLETSGATDAGVIDTVGNTAWGGTAGGAGGIATGVATGTITDWWNKPIRSAFSPKTPPQKVDPSDVSSITSQQSPTQQATEAVKSASKATKETATKEVGTFMDNFKMARQPSQRDIARDELVTRLGQSGSTAVKPAQQLIEDGFDPHVLSELADAETIDLSAIHDATEIASKIIKNPSLATKISVNDPAAMNMLAKADALSELNKPLASALRDMVEGADNSLFNKQSLDSYVTDALPSRSIKLSNADRKFVESLIDRLDEVKTFVDAHEYRQFIANETDQFTAPLRSQGASPEYVDTIAQNIRSAVGKYLDNNITGYAEVRAEEAPILDALSRFWRTMGGKWKTYDGEALTARASQLSRRLSSNTNPDMQQSLEIMDALLSSHGLNIGGDIGKQNFYTRLVENLYGVGKPGAFKSEVSQGILNAASPAGAVRGPKGTLISVAAKLAAKSAGISERRFEENVQDRMIMAFTEFLKGLK